MRRDRRGIGPQAEPPTTLPTHPMDAWRDRMKTLLAGLLALITLTWAWHAVSAGGGSPVWVARQEALYLSGLLSIGLMSLSMFLAARVVVARVKVRSGVVAGVAGCEVAARAELGLALRELSAAGVYTSVLLLVALAGLAGLEPEALLVAGGGGAAVVAVVAAAGKP